MQQILVIDDDVLVRSTISRILERKGYEVLAADDGAQGLSMFERHHPDLVITDIIMPEKEGIETIREIRRLSPEIKIIAISGGGRLGNFDFLDIATQFGAAEVLGKPFDAADLLDRVDRCLGTAD